MKELGEFELIGARIGGGFINTSKVHIMKYDEAITKCDKANWDTAVKHKHARMTDQTALEAHDHIMTFQQE